MTRGRRRSKREPEPTNREADPRTDDVAREAARLVESGREPTVRSAIRAARRRLDAWDAPVPSVGRVREHARSMAMAEQGEAGYVASILDVLAVAAEVMDVLEHAFLGCETALVGRAARGQIDSGVVLHIRLYSEAPIGEIARALVEHDYEEPEFETLTTRVGVLEQIRFDAEGEDVAVLRVPPSVASADRRVDLVTGRRTEILELAALQDVLEEAEEVDGEDVPGESGSDEGPSGPA